MMVGPPQWNGEDQLGSSVSQDKGEMTADSPPTPSASACPGRGRRLLRGGGTFPSAQGRAQLSTLRALGAR